MPLELAVTGTITYEYEYQPRDGSAVPCTLYACNLRVRVRGTNEE